MKDVYYFPHDSNSRRDPKIAALLREFGFEGYGIWWTLIEIMHEQEGGKLEKFPKLIEGLAYQMSPDRRKTKQFEATLNASIRAMIDDFKLLQEDGTHIWSNRVVRNLEERHTKRMKRADAGRLGGIQSGIKRTKEMKQNEAMLQANEANEAKESKVKESSKETPPKHRASFVKPSVQEIEAYCKERGNSINPEKFFNHYEAKGWVVGRAPMKDWRAAVRTWEGDNQLKRESVF